MLLPSHKAVMKKIVHTLNLLGFIVCSNSIANAEDAKCSHCDEPALRSPDSVVQDYIELKKGLSAEFLTRDIANYAAQFDWFPKDNPTHMIWAIRSARGTISDSVLNPSVQRLELASGKVETILRGLDKADAIEVTAWGTVVVGENTEGGAAYEIIHPLATTNVSVFARGLSGEAADIREFNGAVSSNVTKLTALPAIAWSGLAIRPEGFLFATDNHSPGASETSTALNRDFDGGTVYKYVPSRSLVRTDNSLISDLSQSPLLAGRVFSPKAAHNYQFRRIRPQGQGQETGLGVWTAISILSPRTSAAGGFATGFSRPSGITLFTDRLHRVNVPTPACFRPSPPGAVCWANQGHPKTNDYGSVMCLYDGCLPAATGSMRSSSNSVRFYLNGSKDINNIEYISFQPSPVEQPSTLFLSEGTKAGDIWACLPQTDGSKLSDGCIRVLSVVDTSAGAKGFKFNNEGNIAYFVLHDSRDDNMPTKDNYRTDDIIQVKFFGAPTTTPRERNSKVAENLMDNFGWPSRVEVTRPALNTLTENEVQFNAEPPTEVVDLPSPLKGKYISLEAPPVGPKDYYPWKSTGSKPTHIFICNGSSTVANITRLDLSSGEKTIVLNGFRCRDLKTTPWNTIVAVGSVLIPSIYDPESTPRYSGAFEIIDPLNVSNIKMLEPGYPGGPAQVVDSAGNNADDKIGKLLHFPEIAWGAIDVTAEGVIYGTDVLRPSGIYNFNQLSTDLDRDGGTVHKFIPQFPYKAGQKVLHLKNSPFYTGQTYALKVYCGKDEYGLHTGQGCELGAATWVKTQSVNASNSADAAGATGFYSPSSLTIDNTYKYEGVRLCWSTVKYIYCAIDHFGLAQNQEDSHVSRLLHNSATSLSFQPHTGILYVRRNGDISACLPDGPDIDSLSDGCARVLSGVYDNLLFNYDGTQVAFHAGSQSVATDGSSLPSLLNISGLTTDLKYYDFGEAYDATLKDNSLELFGF